MVGGSGIEPLTPSMSRKCSPAELTARQIVMPALVADIHVLAPIQLQGVDGRNKSGHDAAMSRI